MYKRVLFCIPPFPNRYGLPTHPHTGIGYLCESLNRQGIETAVVDFRLGDGYRKLKAALDKFKPDLAGVTMMSYYHNLAYEIVRHLKQSNIPVAIGGPHVSTVREQALIDSGADFGFMMESEISLVRLCQQRPLNDIPGLLYRKNGQVLLNQPQIIEELNEVPYPRYRDFELNSYTRRRIPIITSRGCPCQCTFCPIVTVMGRKYRLRSARNVFAEIEYWYKKGYRDFDFQDDNFIVDRKRVFELCDMIKQAGFNDLFVQCGNGLRADLATRELLLKLKEAGFKATAFGVESADPEVLKKVKKGESIEQIENAVKNALDVGLEVSLFFIVGLPGETAVSFRKSIDFARRYPVTTATFYNLVPFPGTELFDWVKNNNYFLIQPRDYLNTIAHLEFVPVFETPDFSRNERKSALEAGAKLNLQLKRRDMERKLGDTALSKIVSWIVYESFFNKIIFAMLELKPLKQAMNFILLKLRVRFNL